MSGHSKWSQIKRAKGVTDARRGQVFTKLGKEISIAVKQGGPDPAANSRLRLAIEHARSLNMPNDNIERAIKRASGEGATVELAEIVYEGYGPGGAALMIEALTDNRNRTVAEIRAVLTRAGGSLGETGSVGWVFDSKGVVTVTRHDADAEEIALQAIDAGAEDVKMEDGSIEIYTAPDALEAVRRNLEQAGVAIESAELSRVPKNTVGLGDKEAEQCLRLLDRLEELEDVQKVHSNADFPDAVLAAYSG